LQLLEEKLQAFEASPGEKFTGGSFGSLVDSGILTQRLNSLEDHASSHHKYASQLEKRLARIEHGSSDKDSGLEKDRSELKERTDALLTTGQSGHFGDADKEELEPVSRTVHDALLQRLAAMTEKAEKLARVQEEHERRQALDTQIIESLEAESRQLASTVVELKDKLQQTVTSEEYDVLRQKLQRAVEPSEHEALKQQIKALTSEIEALKDPQLHVLSIQGVPLAEYETLKRKLQNSIPKAEYDDLKLQNVQKHAALQQSHDAIKRELEEHKKLNMPQEVENLKQQLRLRVDPEEHSAVKQRLQDLKVEYDGLCGRMAAAEHALRSTVPLSDHDKLKQDLQDHQKASEEASKATSRDVEAWMARFAELKAKHDAHLEAADELQAKHDAQLAAAALEAASVDARKSVEVSTDVIWEEHGFTWEEHKALKEQLKQTVHADTYDALKVKYAALKQDLMNSADETTKLRRAFQDRLTEANQAVAEASMLLGSPPHPVPESWESSSSRVYSPQRVYSPKRQRPPEPVAESSQSSSSRVYSPNFRSGDAAFNEHFVKRMDAVVQEIPYGNGGGGAALVLEELLPYGNGDAALVLEEVVSRSATPIDRSATPTRKVAQLAMPLRQTKINSPRTGANSPPTARYSPRGTPSAQYRMIPAEVSGGGSLKVSRRISRGSRISGGSVQEDVHRGGSLTTPTTIYGGSLTAPTPSLRSGGAATPSVTLPPEPSPYSVATGSTLTSGAPNYTKQGACT
jgi:hypothetical protein